VNIVNEIEIKRHSFDLAKKRLKEFSEKNEAKLKLEKVEEDWGFFFDHKVAGAELNERLEIIQGHLITINTTNNKVIKEFGEVYNALDELDKEYLTSIVANVKAIEKTSNDVRVQQGVLKQHNEKLANQQDKLNANQAEIEKTVANVSKIVTVLKGFKEKLEVYEHLTDIDKIWDDWNTIITVLNSYKLRIQKVEQEGKSHTDQLDELVKADDKIRECIDFNMRDINYLKKYKETLGGISHLEDIDSIWKDVEGHTAQLTEIEKKDEELSTTIQKNKDEVENKITDAVQMTNDTVESLSKRVKYAYWIAGGSAGLAIIELILLLMKVI